MKHGIEDVYLARLLLRALRLLSTSTRGSHPHHQTGSVGERLLASNKALVALVLEGVPVRHEPA